MSLSAEWSMKCSKIQWWMTMLIELGWKTVDQQRLTWLPQIIPDWGNFTIGPIQLGRWNLDFHIRLTFYNSHRQYPVKNKKKAPIPNFLPEWLCFTMLLKIPVCAAFPTTLNLLFKILGYFTHCIAIFIINVFLKLEYLLEHWKVISHFHDCVGSSIAFLY